MASLGPEVFDTADGGDMWEFAALQASLALEDVRFDAVYGGSSTTVAMFSRSSQYDTRA